MAEFDPVPDSEAPVDDGKTGLTPLVGSTRSLWGLRHPQRTQTLRSCDCSPNAAKKHLERLSEMGIVRENQESRPAQYERNEGYLEWQDASRIADELAVEEIIDRVRSLKHSVRSTRHSSRRQIRQQSLCSTPNATTPFMSEWLRSVTGRSNS